jgi:hypothetical protein
MKKANAQNTSKTVETSTPVKKTFKIKTYKSIDEWLKSKPSALEMEKILSLINRQNAREVRFEIMRLQGVIRKNEKINNYLVSQGIKINFDAKNAEIQEEIDALYATLPVPKKKEETKVTDLSGPVDQHFKPRVPGKKSVNLLEDIDQILNTERELDEKEK